jgi:hypothetical protein
MGRVALLESDLPSQHMYRSMRRLQAKQSREQKLLALQLEFGQLKYERDNLRHEVQSWQCWYAEKCNSYQYQHQVDSLLQELVGTDVNVGEEISLERCGHAVVDPVPTEVYFTSLLSSLSSPSFSSNFADLLGSWEPLELCHTLAKTDPQPQPSPPVDAADLGPIENMGRVAASTVEAPSHADAGSQTAADYTLSPDGTVTLTLAEADRLWARKHQELLQEFEVMMESQAKLYEEKVRKARTMMNEICERAAG